MLHASLRCVGRGGVAFQAGHTSLALSPAVSKGLVVIDLGKGGVDGSKFVSNPLDARADIRSVAIFAAPRDESDVMHAVVDCPVGYVTANVRGQQVHDLEFRERQINIGIVPEGTADPRLQYQPAAMEIVHQVGFAGLLHRIGDQPETVGQDGNTARLVDEVQRAAIEGEFLVGRLRAASQEHHRQGDAYAAQARQQIDAGHRGQTPVQHDDFRVGAVAERAEKRVAVRESRHIKSVIGKLVAHSLTVVVVIFDERDSNSSLFLTRDTWFAWHEHKQFLIVIGYSTVTLLARLRGWSTSVPLATAV